MVGGVGMWAQERAEKMLISDRPPELFAAITVNSER
jgi:hypothetical protein